MNTRKEYQGDPETPINIKKTAKKSFINWIVPMLGAAICVALFTVVKSWADDRYTRKADMEIRFGITDGAIQSETKKREISDAKVQEVIQKLDLIIYILQHNGTINSQEMKGKLSPP